MRKQHEKKSTAYMCSRYIMFYWSFGANAGKAEDGKWYFFLPACVESDTICINPQKGPKILINGKQVQADSLFQYESNQIYEIAITDNKNNQFNYQITFMKSDNIPAVFIETESGNMEYIDENKYNEEKGYISIVKENGNVEYAGNLDRISGRGNTSWEYNKKPYVIKLKNAEALLGMDAGKKWYLLPVWREGNRMNTKVVMDIASELGLSYTPECTWIDLYLNGE